MVHHRMRHSGLFIFDFNVISKLKICPLDRYRKNVDPGESDG